MGSWWWVQADRLGVRRIEFWRGAALDECRGLGGAVQVEFLMDGIRFTACVFSRVGAGWAGSLGTGFRAGVESTTGLDGGLLVKSGCRF